MIAVNALLKVYNEIAIVKALESPKGKTIYSTRCPWLDEIILDEEEKIKNVPDVPVVIEKLPTEVKPQAKSFGNKTNLNKLRELDG